MLKKPFTVQNKRNRHTVRLHGVTLAPPYSKGKSTMDMTLEELLDPASVRLFKVGRLALIRGEMPPELVTMLLDQVEKEGLEAVGGIHFETQPELSPASPGVDTSVPPLKVELSAEEIMAAEDAKLLAEIAALEGEQVPVLVPGEPEPVLTIEESPPIDRIDAARIEEIEAMEKEEEVFEDDPTAASGHTFESLKALTMSQLRKMAKSLKLKSSGNEDELINRILNHQAGGS